MNYSYNESFHVIHDLPHCSSNSNNNKADESCYIPTTLPSSSETTTSLPSSPLMLADNHDNGVYKKNASSSSEAATTQSIRKLLKKSVSFAPRKTIYTNNTKQPEDISTLWYREHELIKFKKDAKTFVKILRKLNWNLSAAILLQQQQEEKKGCSTSSPNEDATRDFCLRGYEAYFSMSLNKEIKLKRSFTINCVLNEQERQRELNIMDPELIRTISCVTTQWAKDRALDIGIEDSNEAYNIYYCNLNNNYYTLNPADDSCQ